MTSTSTRGRMDAGRPRIVLFDPGSLGADGGIATPGRMCEMQPRVLRRRRATPGHVVKDGAFSVESGSGLQIDDPGSGCERQLRLCG